MPRALTASQRAIAASRGRLASPMEMFDFYRKSFVPEGGWTFENFHGEAKRRVWADMVNIHNAAVLRGSRTLAFDLRKLMTGQIERVLISVVDGIARLYGVSLKREGISDEEAALLALAAIRVTGMWETAIRQEMDHTDLETIALFMPVVTSVSANTFGKTNIVLGYKPTPVQVASLNVRNRALAAKVTNINDTTRELLRKHILKGIEKGSSVGEVIADIRKNIPSIATNRIPTIDRTELGRAADEGVKHAMLSYGLVTHFSVIGCTKIEPRGPTLLGWPTCNLENVPIEYIDQIEFHPNHTGAIVLEAVRASDGSVEDLPLGSGTMPEE